MATTESLPHVTLPVGTRLEKYELREVQGLGGGGISYRAFDCELKREVVLKEHFPVGVCRREPGTAEVQVVNAAGYELSLASFCRGARILAGLQHESAVKVHEIFSACGTAFLVMDYVEGATLREWAATHPTAADICRLLSKLLSALEYLHGAGVIHRDIKPTNIIVRKDGLPVLIDFDAAMVSDPTHTPTQVGTPGYAAPEQFTPGAIPGPQADIYALGCSLRRVAAETGQRLPRRIERTLRRACAEQPAQRYSSAADWQRALSPARGRWLLAGSAALIVTAAYGWWFLPGGAETQQPDVTATVTEQGAEHPTPAQPASVEQASATPAPPAEQDFPTYHPMQLIRLDSWGEFECQPGEDLPPREQAFVTAVKSVQSEFDTTRDELNTLKQNNKLKSGKYYRSLAEAKDKANEKVAELIHEFVTVNYADKDPAEGYTELFINTIRQANPYKRMAAVHATHPAQLIKYDEHGYLVQPDFVRGTENEIKFATALLAYQQEYHAAIKHAEQEAEAAQTPLTPEQRTTIQQREQLLLNQKVLKLVDEYIERYIEEDHPEFSRNAALREAILKHNIHP